MKYLAARFFVEFRGMSYRVEFVSGRSVKVWWHEDGERKDYNVSNGDRAFKPCVAHCEQLIRMALRFHQPNAAAAKKVDRVTKPIAVFQAGVGTTK